MPEGAWIVFHARIADERIAELTFHAYGCPHLIAACDRTVELLSGQSPRCAFGFDLHRVMDELDIPVEKLGRLLVLQDALRNCFRDWDTTQPDQGAGDL